MNNFLKLLQLSTVRDRKIVSGGIQMYKIPRKLEIRFNLSWMVIYVKYIYGKREMINIILDIYLNSDTKDHCHTKQNLTQ